MQPSSIRIFRYHFQSCFFAFFSPPKFKLSKWRRGNGNNGVKINVKFLFGFARKFLKKLNKSHIIGYLNQNQDHESEKNQRQDKKRERKKN